MWNWAVIDSPKPHSHLPIFAHKGLGEGLARAYGKNVSYESFSLIFRKSFDTRAYIELSKYGNKNNLKKNIFFQNSNNQQIPSLFRCASPFEMDGKIQKQKKWKKRVWVKSVNQNRLELGVLQLRSCWQESLTLHL